MALIDKNTLKLMTVESNIQGNMLGVLSMEKHFIYVKPGFDTACWHYSFKDEAHKICIGDGIFDRISMGYTNYQKIVDSYFIHEAAHSIYTCKNLVELQKKLKEEKLSFRLFNLFEDAKIEHKIRENFGYNFNWTDFEDISPDAPDEKATTTLFKIIQTEDREYFDVPYYEKVKNYYDKIVKAKDENEMIEIMKNWITDFPNDVEPEQNRNMGQGKGQDAENSESNEQQQGKGQGQKGENEEEKGKDKEQEEKSDLEIAAELQGNADLEDEFEKDAEIVVGDAKQQQEELEEELDKKDKRNVKYLEEVVANGASLPTSNTNSIFQNVPFQEKKINKEKLEDAEQKLTRILRTIGLEEINSMNHSQKFNIKGVIQAKNGNPNAKPYKKQTEEDYEFGKKKVFILMDGSGSMSGVPEKNMLTFAVAINRLANKRLFEGWIGGSKVIGRNSLNQALTLPVSDGQLTSFSADSNGEGIGYAIKSNIDNIKTADYVFVLTDGQIHDLDLEFIKKNMPDVYNKTLGIYMGERIHSNERAMKLWFKHTISDSKFENVIEEIVKLLDPKQKTHSMLNALDIKDKQNDYREQISEQILNPF